MRKFIASLTLAVGALVLAAPASADIIVRLTPAATHINLGGSTDVEMTIEGLGDEILAAFDINLLFDGGILNNGVVFHNAIPSAFGAFPNSYFETSFAAGNTGVIDGSLMSDEDLAAMQANAFLVLTFGVSGIANGASLLDLGAAPLFDRNFVGLDFKSLAVQVIGACISVGTGECRQEVPEPSMLSLLGLALAGGMFGFRRRRTV